MNVRSSVLLQSYRTSRTTSGLSATRNDPKVGPTRSFDGRSTIHGMATSGNHAASRHEVIDLFAGPGGLDVGAYWLGLSAVGIEWDENACATRAAAGLPTIHGDVREYDPADFPGATILTGGPPCQTYTVAGGGSGRRALDKVISLVARMAKGSNIGSSLKMLEDERTGLVLEPLRWALQAIEDEDAYEAIVLEQVPAVLPIWQAIRAVLETHGYEVDCGVLRTEEFGVPQTRRRAILVARLGDSVALPTPTHQQFRRGDAQQYEFDRLPWVPLKNVLDRDLPFTVISNYGSGGDPKNRGKRTSDEPSATVTGKVTRNRIRTPDGESVNMSVHEAGRLQTFPSNYPWRGRDISQQIGNAIPPRLAAHVLAAATKTVIDPQMLDRAASADWPEFQSEQEQLVESI